MLTACSRPRTWRHNLTLAGEQLCTLHTYTGWGSHYGSTCRKEYHDIWSDTPCVLSCTTKICHLGTMLICQLRTYNLPWKWKSHGSKYQLDVYQKKCHSNFMPAGYHSVQFSLENTALPAVLSGYWPTLTANECRYVLGYDGLHHLMISSNINGAKTPSLPALNRHFAVHCHIHDATQTMTENKRWNNYKPQKGIQSLSIQEKEAWECQLRIDKTVSIGQSTSWSFCSSILKS